MNQLRVVSSLCIRHWKISDLKICGYFYPQNTPWKHRHEWCFLKSLIISERISWSAVCRWAITGCVSVHRILAESYFYASLNTTPFLLSLISPSDTRLVLLVSLTNEPAACKVLCLGFVPSLRPVSARYGTGISSV